MKDLLEKFVKKNRNYRGYDLWNNIVDKVFNRGMGAINLFRFYETEKIIVINKLFFNKADERKLKTFCEEKGMTEWTWRFCELGYADWYGDNMSINLCK